jgi:hypothetical protein
VAQTTDANTGKAKSAAAAFEETNVTFGDPVLDASVTGFACTQSGVIPSALKTPRCVANFATPIIIRENK